VENETGLVVLAAKESENVFWNIEPYVHIPGIQIEAFFSEDELLESLGARLLRPAVVMLSAAFTEQPVSEAISQIKKRDEHLPVVVVAADTTEELERDVRCAGIFYYLTLPAHRDEVEQVTLWALRAGGR